jgi:hypothetical protein
MNLKIENNTDELKKERKREREENQNEKERNIVRELCQREGKN